MYTLWNIIISVVVSVLGGIGASYVHSSLALLSVIYALAVLIPGLAVTVRRLHDTDRTGWWILVSLIPIIGLILLYFLVQEGQQGPNRYGRDPKTAMTI
jgi:uncharacterized membrane protein YhaH (DUF805 family)